MNKGIPYLLSALVALTLSAGWAAPVLALFQHVATCLQDGGSMDLMRMRCEPPVAVADALLHGWGFWLMLIVVATVVALATTRTGTRPRRNRPTSGLLR
ncbi:MAG: hypothetical protein ACREPD_00750 [Stenotrophomonas sp.]|uniref:hypothetical protein n=1 Tax=Stenotrophomonas sp. TaxID=69392 RepID=UPI003D6D8535